MPITLESGEATAILQGVAVWRLDGCALLAFTPQTSPTGSLGGNPIFLVLTICLGSAAALTLAPEWTGVLTFIFVMSGWILAVGLHEFGHALIAYLGGDWTVRSKGYLSMDPRKYADLQTTLIFPLIALALGGIGFPGGAVYLQENLMRSRLWRSASALAGPLGTLVIMLGLGLALKIFPPPASQAALTNAIAFLTFLQATALVLNLIPLPGLDGYGAIRPFLPTGIRAAVRRYETLAPLVLLAAIFFVPGVSGAFFSTAFQLTELLGLSRMAIFQGLHTFQFWKS